MSTIYFLDIEGNKCSEIICEHALIENDNSTTDNVCFDCDICDNDSNNNNNNNNNNS